MFGYVPCFIDDCQIFSLSLYKLSFHSVFLKLSIFKMCVPACFLVAIIKFSGKSKMREKGHFFFFGLQVQGTTVSHGDEDMAADREGMIGRSGGWVVITVSYSGS